MTRVCIRSKGFGTATAVTMVIGCAWLVGCGSGGGKPQGAGGAAAGGASGGAGAAGGSAMSVGGAAGGGAVATATVFVSDSINNAVYRFNVTPASDPVATGVLHPGFQPAGIGLAPTGELLVADDVEGGAIARYAAPLTTLTPNGTITGLGTSRVWDMALADGEVWASNSTLDCSTTPEGIVRIAFDAQGTASVAGTIATGLLGADRGILWVPGTRTLFVGQCYPVNVIQRYQVAADETVTAGAPLTGNGISNPEGLVIAPWGELLVPNFGNGSGGMASGPGHELLRYVLDAQGNPTPNGAIEGNGLNGPCYGAFTPWGELLVTNTADATLSRFTFDASHVAIAHGTFPLGAAPSPNGNFGVCPIIIVPGASM